MEPLGTRLRRQRRRVGLTLDELAACSSISKPYLSLIETGRVVNPPSDEKLRKLESVLGFAPGELVSQAHLTRTPKDIRSVLRQLVRDRAASDGQRGAGGDGEAELGEDGQGISTKRGLGQRGGGPINLDEAYVSGVLQNLVEQSASNVERVSVGMIPVINKVSAGYPKDFTDLSYPRGVADEYLSGPEVNDPDAFATRVCGDSMTPKYREGDIVFFSPSATVRDGDDCFVRFESGETTFKRVFFEMEAGVEMIRLQPRNERYRPLTLGREQVSGLYRAVFRYQKVDED